MKRTLAALAFGTSILAGPTAWADAPTPEQVKAVWDFHEKGQGGGIVIGDVKLCDEIPKKGDLAYECATELPADIKVGTKVYVWIAYLMPKGDTLTDVTVQVKQGDVTRDTKDLGDMKGGDQIRARTWTVVVPRKAGAWSINVLKGDKVLKSVPMNVVPEK